VRAFEPNNRLLWGSSHPNPSATSPDIGLTQPIRQTAPTYHHLALFSPPAVFSNSNMIHTSDTLPPKRKRETSFYIAFLVILPVYLVGPLAWIFLSWELSTRGFLMIGFRGATWWEKVLCYWAVVEVSALRVRSVSVQLSPFTYHPDCIFDISLLPSSQTGQPTRTIRSSPRRPHQQTLSPDLAIRSSGRVSAPKPFPDRGRHFRSSSRIKHPPLKLSLGKNHTPR
jgi:hypothetical protein